jgi:hypothetical protein
VKFIIFISVNVFGYVGWVLGEYFSMGWAFGLSAVGSLMGVYLGWLFARKVLGQ